MTDNQPNEKQGEIKTSDQLQAEVMADSDQVNQTAQANLNHPGEVLSQPTADNPDEPLAPDYTGTLDTTDL